MNNPWQSIFDAIREPLCMVDSESRLLRCNRGMEALTGCAAEELTGKPIDEILRPLGAGDAFFNDILRRSHEPRAMELPLGDKWFRVSIGPGPDGSNALVLTDLTERKQLEEQLLQRAEALSAVDHQKDEFLAMLAHELRNPLAAISAGMQVIERIGSQDERVVRVRRLLLRQTKHLTRLVDDLLDVSRITRGNIELRKERVELGGLLKQSVEVVRPALEERGHTFQLVLDESPIWLNADSTRLEQVFVNLLGNAVKYTPNEGEISVRVWVDGGAAIIRVTDSGIGIDSATMQSIFELFSQGEQPLDRSRGGLGVGLTLVRSLLRMHDGTVRAKSAGMGKGSEFEVRLPLGPAISAGAEEPVGVGGVARRRILIVEDNADARDALKDLLEELGHRVDVAVDGPAGVEKALRLSPDLALVDIGLPGMDGYQVARTLRAHPAGRAMLLIALTGYGGSQQRKRALDAGFDLHLVKPLDLDELSLALNAPTPRGNASEEARSGSPVG
jgi:PAS domain S-box-containing protein